MKTNESRLEANLGNCRTAQRKKPAGMVPTGSNSIEVEGLGQRSNPLGQARKLPRDRILVENTRCNATRHFRLGGLKRGCGFGLVARFDRSFDLLYEGTDAADTVMVDHRTTSVATDALLGLRRIRHMI